MRNVWTIALIAALTSAACNARTEAPGSAPAQASATVPDGAIPAPAASHALTPPTAPKSAAVEADTVSALAHHATPPVTAPAVDPVAVAPLEAGAIRDSVERPAAATFREVTIPVGTTLSIQLADSVSSGTSRVEESVQATLRNAVVVNGVTVMPAGSAVSGYVSEASRSARVKGRARVGVRFNSVRVNGDRYTIRTSAVSRQAPGTKKEDAVKIGVGAGAGAVVGAIAGGKQGAAIGTAVGAAGGTGVVLATRGEEVSLARGTVVTTKLSAPVTVRVRN
jgi:hypothetical protein